MQRLLVLIALFIYCSKICGQSSKVESLLQIVALNRQDDDEMKALFTLADNCYRSDPDAAKKYLHRNLELAVPADNFYRQVGAYSLLLTLYQQEGNADSAVWYVNKLKTVAANAPSNNKVQLNYNQAIGLYYKKKGEFKTALPYLLAVATYAESTTDKAWIGGQWLNAGNVYCNLGDYNNAMACHLKALRFFEEAGNRLGESFCYNSIAVSYYKLKQYSNAAEHAQKSLALKKSLKDKRGICVSELQLGEIYRSMGNTQQAFKKFETALKIAKEEKMLTEEATCYL